MCDLIPCIPYTTHFEYKKESLGDLVFQTLQGPDCGDNYCPHRYCWQMTGLPSSEVRGLY